MAGLRLVARVARRVARRSRRTGIHIATAGRSLRYGFARGQLRSSMNNVTASALFNVRGSGRGARIGRVRRTMRRRLLNRRLRRNRLGRFA